MDTDETNEEAQDTGPALDDNLDSEVDDNLDSEVDDNLDSEVDDFTIEEDDHVFMAMVYQVDPHHFVRALSTVSGCLAEAFAKELKAEGFRGYCSNFTAHLC
jgi:hypothetical protein